MILTYETHYILTDEREREMESHGIAIGKICDVNESHIVVLSHFFFFSSRGNHLQGTQQS